MVNPRFDLKTIFTGKTNEKSKPKFAFLINYREEVKEELRHETAIIDQSIILSEIRKFYLFNSTFLSIMIFIFSIIVLKMIILFTEIPFKNYVLYIFLGIYLLGIQVPYIVGQKRLHEDILQDFIGKNRKDFEEKLSKYSPAFPKFELIKTITLSGTAGGIMLYLVTEFLKEYFK